MNLNLASASPFNNKICYTQKFSPLSLCKEFFLSSQLCQYYSSFCCMCNSLLSSLMPFMQTTQQNFFLIKNNPIINASFVFIVFFWPWCLLPLGFRSQQQIKDLVTLLRDKEQTQNFKIHRTYFPGLCMGKSFVFLLDLSPLLCFYFNSPSVSLPKTYWHPWEAN